MLKLFRRRAARKQRVRNIKYGQSDPLLLRLCNRNMQLAKLRWDRRESVHTNKRFEGVNFDFDSDLELLDD